MSLSVALSTHSVAAVTGSSTTSWMMPAALAFLGSTILPCSRNGEAAMAPIMRMKRVVPPMPGKIPTMISGRPILAFGLSAAKMRWVASGNSRPMPSAVPGRAEAIGLPPLLVLGSMPARSILRRNLWPIMVKSNSACAGSSPASARIEPSTFRSIPPAKVSLPDVITAPLISSLPSTSSMQASKSPKASRLSTFIDLDFTSQVMMATPLSPTFIVKSVMFLILVSAGYTRSMMVAAPMPDAMQSVAKPVSLS
mmetsp:Transcript_28960/g.55424  ORF Transcript_28960/g.55424 Transcript_28960/m.55424 type:complete len:253 (+) Transcript_28960:1737-2495(+)